MLVAQVLALEQVSQAHQGALQDRLVSQGVVAHPVDHLASPPGDLLDSVDLPASAARLAFRVVVDPLDSVADKTGRMTSYINFWTT